MIVLHWGDKVSIEKYYITSFVVVLYLEQPIIYFRVVFSISDISDIIFCPLLTKLSATL